MMMHVQKQSGLTLIEVLVALAIIALGMTAAIKAVSTDIRGVQHLQDKTMALWVGEQILNEARLGILKLSAGSSLRQETRLLGRNWYWVLSQHTTPNPRINSIKVGVYVDEKAVEEEVPLLELTSYIYLVPINDEKVKP